MAGIGILVEKLCASEPTRSEAIGDAQVKLEIRFMVPDPGGGIARPDIFEVHVGGEHQTIIEEVLLEQQLSLKSPLARSDGRLQIDGNSEIIGVGIKEPIDGLRGKPVEA